MTMTAKVGKKMITLRSSDGEEYEMDQAMVKQSITTRSLIKNACSKGGIPLLNVNSKILMKIFEYWKKHDGWCAQCTAPCAALRIPIEINYNLLT